MLAALQKILSFQLTLAEWTALGLIGGVPYLFGGVVWSISHGDRFVGLGGVELAAAIAGAVVSWPVLLVPTACVP